MRAFRFTMGFWLFEGFVKKKKNIKNGSSLLYKSTVVFTYEDWRNVLILNECPVPYFQKMKKRLTSDMDSRMECLRPRTQPLMTKTQTRNISGLKNAWDWVKETKTVQYLLLEATAFSPSNTLFLHSGGILKSYQQILCSLPPSLDLDGKKARWGWTDRDKRRRVVDERDWSLWAALTQIQSFCVACRLVSESSWSCVYLIMCHTDTLCHLAAKKTCPSAQDQDWLGWPWCTWLQYRQW